MPDTFTRSQRSAIMRAVNSYGSRPEMLVRRVLHCAGYRYRLHAKHLPGCPDIIFAGRRKVLQVFGCFWHQHPQCAAAGRPASNQTYWNAKLDGNVARDLRSCAALHSLGWEALIVWECQTRDADALKQRLVAFLGPPRLVRGRRELAEDGSWPQDPLGSPPRRS